MGHGWNHFSQSLRNFFPLVRSWTISFGFFHVFNDKLLVTLVRVRHMHKCNIGKFPIICCSFAHFVLVCALRTRTIAPLHVSACTNDAKIDPSKCRNDKLVCRAFQKSVDLRIHLHFYVRGRFIVIAYNMHTIALGHSAVVHHHMMVREVVKVSIGPQSIHQFH